jgi:hypothetical protein
MLDNFTDGVLYATTQGTIDFNYMKSRIEAVYSEKDLPDKIKILEEAHGAIAEFSPEEIEELTVLMKKLASRFTSIHHAVIHDNPINTAFTMLLSDLVSTTNYHLLPFSTVAAAKTWLKIK